MTFPPRTRSTAARPTTIIPARAPSCRWSTRACSCRSTGALTVESRYFAHVLRSPEAAAMIRSLFVSMQELNKGARRPGRRAAAEAQEGRHHRRRLHGRRHRLCQRAGRHRGGADRPRPGERREGQGHVDKLMTGRSIAAAPSGATRRAAGADHADADYARSPGCDLVIEAVFEDRKVKADVIAKAQAVAPDVDLRLQHLDAADHLACGNRQGPGRSSSASTSSRRSSA
jgi:3-hydroxyacyl-CoA dehydrogenase / enoyl-CoA hydratase / 3-hydroxybutyryl-CoA epimerase